MQRIRERISRELKECYGCSPTDDISDLAIGSEITIEPQSSDEDPCSSQSGEDPYLSQSSEEPCNGYSVECRGEKSINFNPEHANEMSTVKLYVPLSRSDCPQVLQHCLPSACDYSYVIESFHQYDRKESHFYVVLRISISNKEEANKWLCEFSKCTYRVTETTKTALKRVVAKFTMHCQHLRKLYLQSKRKHSYKLQ